MSALTKQNAQHPSHGGNSAWSPTASYYTAAATSAAENPLPAPDRQHPGVSLAARLAAGGGTTRDARPASSGNQPGREVRGAHAPCRDAGGTTTRFGGRRGWGGWTTRRLPTLWRRGLLPRTHRAGPGGGWCQSCGPLHEAERYGTQPSPPSNNKKKKKKKGYTSSGAPSLTPPSAVGHPQRPSPTAATSSSSWPSEPRRRLPRPRRTARHRCQRGGGRRAAGASGGIGSSPADPASSTKRKKKKCTAGSESAQRQRPTGRRPAHSGAAGPAPTARRPPPSWRRPGGFNPPRMGPVRKNPAHHMSVTRMHGEVRAATGGSRRMGKAGGGGE